jgi:prophage DNA circulation protein
MTWRDRIDPDLRGSYRGVEFFVERADTTGGRRWLVHEYPRRDVPYAEDMGRRAKEWRLTLFVAGDDYDRQRDKLIEALDAPGSATLVHPYLGTKVAVASEVRFSESTRQGGVCEFEVTFAEDGLQGEPTLSVDTQREVQRAAVVVEAEAEQDFARRWNIDLAGWSSAIERDLAAVIDGLNQVVGDVSDQIASVIRSPANIAGMLAGGYNRLRNAVKRPVNALELYSGDSALSMGSAGRLRTPAGTPARAVRMLLAVGISGDSVAGTAAGAAEDAQRASNIQAANQLNGRLAASTAARVVADADWLSRQDAEAAGRDALALIDHTMETAEPISDDMYNALVALRAALSADLRARALAMPNLTQYTPQATLPALVVAQRLYGDATRADEICLRNNIRHPGALRGGMALEVVSE